MSRGGVMILGAPVIFVFIGIVGSLFIRFYCELIIIGFKILEELVSIRKAMPPAPPNPAAAIPVIPPPNGQS
jgi:hypothetical protein